MRDVRTAELSPTGLTIAQRTDQEHLLVVPDDLPHDSKALSAVLDTLVAAELSSDEKRAAGLSR